MDRQHFFKALLTKCIQPILKLTVSLYIGQIYDVIQDTLRGQLLLDPNVAICCHEADLPSQSMCC